MEKEIEQLNRILVEWRAAHRPPTPLPDDVWKGAVAIASRAGFAVTAKALKLDCSTLRRRAQTYSSPSSSPEFVEIFAGLQAQARTVDCVVEVQSSSGSRLRIEAKNVDVSELSTWVRDFRD